MVKIIVMSVHILGVDVTLVLLNGLANGGINKV
jgi:hypothetical protein